MKRFKFSLWIAVLYLGVFQLAFSVTADEPFRPEAGKFPPLEKAYAYRGELVFVDHANRRGSIRVQGAGTYFRNAPHPIAMLPYGTVRYHGAPADLRDIPLGTVLHIRAFLPPDPKVPKLFDRERIILGQFFHVACIPAMVTELMSRLGNPDFRNGERIPLPTQAKRGDPRYICLKGEYHQVINSSKIIAGLRIGYVTLGAFSVPLGNFRKWSIQPDVSTSCANLCFTDRIQVLVEASFVVCPHFLLESPHLCQIVVEDAGFAAQSPSLCSYTSFGFLKQRRKDLAASAHRGKLDSVGGPRKRSLRQGYLHGRIASVSRRELGHFLVDGNGVSLRRPDFSAGQPNVDAVVMMTQAPG